MSEQDMDANWHQDEELMLARTEIEQLKTELEAEIERLKDRIDEHHRMFEPMRAEVERLREELEFAEGKYLACYNAKCEVDREIERLRAHLRLIRNIAANNTTLHPPSVVAHIDRVLAGEPSDAPPAALEGK